MKERTQKIAYAVVLLVSVIVLPLPLALKLQGFPSVIVTVLVAYAVGIAAGVIGWMAWSNLSAFTRSLVPFLEELYVSLRFDTADDVRCTVYVPALFRRGYLRKATPYVPIKARKMDRAIMLHESKGVVGKCWRTKNICIEVLDEEASKKFVDYTVGNWGFTEKEASFLKRDRRAYLCVPILDRDGDLTAVLYFDSRNPNAFTPEVVSRIEKQLGLLEKNLKARGTIDAA